MIGDYLGKHRRLGLYEGRMFPLSGMLDRMDRKTRKGERFSVFVDNGTRKGTLVEVSRHRSLARAALFAEVNPLCYSGCLMVADMERMQIVEICHFARSA